MLKKLVILLEVKYLPVIGAKVILRLSVLRQELQKSGVSVSWDFVPPLEAFGGDRKDCLYITDSPENYDRLRLWGYHAAALVHEGNQNAVFRGKVYIMEGLESLEYSYLREVYRRLAGIPWDILETKHLKVRESTVEDVDEFYRIYREPSITYYMENLFPDPEQERAYMKNYISQIYDFYGYGLWTVLLKETGQIIGRAGLSVREGYDLPELGFVIEVEHQGKGYAYEVCCAILEYAEEKLEFEGVQALVRAGNQASLGLLKKLGFHRQSDVKEEGMDYQLYEKHFAQCRSESADEAEYGEENEKTEV